MANLFLWGRLDLSGHFAGHYSDDDFGPVTVRVRNQMRHSSWMGGGGQGDQGMDGQIFGYVHVCVSMV